MYFATYLQHEEEPPQSVGKEGSNDQSEKLSKAALKNKRKREAKQKAKDHEQVRPVLRWNAMTGPSSLELYIQWLAQQLSLPAV